MAARPRLLVTTGAPGWHGRRLARAFEALGCETVFADLAHCRVDPQAGLAGIAIPGFGAGLPRLVLVREIAAGSFEQVTLRLGFLHLLGLWGVPVVNSARAVERTVDKSATTLLLHKAGVPSPPTWVTESRDAARDIVGRETAAGHRVVSKPLFGSQGKGLRLLASAAELPPAEACQGVYYLQRFVPAAGGGDYRVFVIGARAVAAMRRIGPTWIHNVALGARCERVDLTEDLAAPAAEAARAVEAEYAGVDLVRDDLGRVQVLEVNGIPAWRGLQSVCETDIAAELARHLAERFPAAFE